MKKAIVLKKPAKLALLTLIGVLVIPVASAADIAKVNGKPITDKDIKGAVSGFNEGQRQNILKDVNSRRQILSSLIDQEVLVQEGEKEKMDQDTEYKDALAIFRKQF